jgi:Zn-dependent M28 family amino/carboxypeptidase
MTLATMLKRDADRFAARVSPEQLRTRLTQMPTPRNRLHFPERMDGAAELIEGWFSECGLEVWRQPFTVTDVIGYRDHKPFDKIPYPRLDGVNVVATQAGTDEGAVVLLAHYDTVRDSPGADDNTASVVALAEVARLLAGRTPRLSVVFAATDLEEAGFFGAHALAELLTQRHKLRLAVNFECLAYVNAEPGSQNLAKGLGLFYPRQVGRINRRGRRADFLALLHNGSAAGPTRMLSGVLASQCAGVTPMRLRDPNGLPIVGAWIRRRIRAARHFRRSDHVAFWDRRVPAVQVTDTANLRYPHYHRATDTADRLDYDHLRGVVAATAAVIGHLCGHSR